ncbi:MAG: nucleotidyltransferase domain-containing protein [Aeromicrobium sp.]
MNFREPFGGVIPGARGAVLAVLLRTGKPLTGRQIHGLISDTYSLWSAQEALKALTQIGLVETQTVGRAGLHVINERHSSIAPLRALVDPIMALESAIGEAIDSNVQAVILFGSVARGEATPKSESISQSFHRRPGMSASSYRTPFACSSVTTAMCSCSPKPNSVGSLPLENRSSQTSSATASHWGQHAAGQAWSSVMAAAEQPNHAKAFLRKAEEYLASAEDNLDLERYTPAAGDAIHAGISAKDAIVTALTGSTSRGKDHARGTREISRALAQRPEAATADRALRELIAAKSDVGYGTALVTSAKA